MADVTQAAEAANLTIADVLLTGDHLLIQPLAIPERAGRFYIPETAGNRERPQRGLVIQRGAGQWNEAGTDRRPMTVPVGALVFFGKYSGVDQAVNGIPYLLMSEDEVLMFVERERFTVVEHEDSAKNHLAGDYCELCEEPDAKAARERLERERLFAAGKLSMVKHLDRRRDHIEGEPCEICDNAAAKGETVPQRSEPISQEP